MPAGNHPTQPSTPGSLFRLPPELRVVIFKMVIFDQPSRVCSLAPHSSLRQPYPNLQSPGKESDALFVCDYPSLRYVSRDTCQETKPLYNKVGWQISDQEHPKRRFNPDIDVLYLGPQGFDVFHRFLTRCNLLLGLAETGKPFPTAAAQVRDTRHLAIEYSDMRRMRPRARSSRVEQLLRSCPRLEKVTMTVTKFDRNPFSQRDAERQPFTPARQSKLTEVPSLESFKSEEPEADVLFYVTTTYWTKRAYSKVSERLEAVHRASMAFRATAQRAAERLGRHWEIFPPPQPAMLLQMTRWSDTDGGEYWEEVEMETEPVPWYNRLRKY